MLQRAGALLQGVIDTILPPACLGCRQPVSGMGNLCADCFSDVTFISDPLCTICGLPFQTPTAPDTLCGDCIARRPVFSQARSATIYGGKTRDIILALKHGDRTDMAPYLARWLLRAGQDLITPETIITSVPLHASRLRARKYNQAGLLATALGRQAGCQVINDLIIRSRKTRSQGGLTGRGRHRNVSGAFRISDRQAEKIDDAPVLLIDDVFTTGATVDATARTLYRAGARDVAVLTLSRVVIMG